MDSQILLQHLKTGGSFLWELACLFGFIFYVYLEKLLRLFVARPLKSLEGEVILLTGAGNGIGKQIAFQLANVGATLICWDNETVANEQTVAELKKKGTKAHAYTIDISDRDAVRKATQKIRDEHGDVTVIINNAGISPNGPFMTITPEQMEKTFEVNLFAHFWIIREFLPSMLARNHGHIVTTASLSSFTPARDITTYAASKHAVHGFIESLKQEISYSATPGNPSKIHFTTVYPIFVRTRMLDGITFLPKYASKVPMVTPEYIAKKTVEGFRQNYEHLCLPPATVIIAMLRAVLPASIIRYMEEGILRCEIDRSGFAAKNGSTANGNGKKAN